MRTTIVTAMIAATSFALHEELPTVYKDDFSMGWFDNKIDHNNEVSEATYKQRFWSNDAYCEDKATCPIFVYICGEYTCSVPDFRFAPFMMGAAHGAELFVVEHRYYGESQPFDDWSLQNLEFLTTQQALDDLAVFLQAQHAGSERRTLVIGGSYPGAMSAWFRYHYPDIAAGSWASSAVTDHIVDYWQMDEQTYTSTLRSGEGCPAAVQQSVQYVNAQGVLRDAGEVNDIDSYLATTANSTGMRTDDFMFYYADIFVESVQYGNRTNLCDIFEQHSADNDSQMFERLTAFATEVVGVNTPDYDTRILSDVTIDTETSGRQWTYQYCTEIGFF